MTALDLCFFIFLNNVLCSIIYWQLLLQFVVKKSDLPKVVLLNFIKAVLGPQEELILDIVNNPRCKPKEYKHSYLQSILILLLCTLVVRHSICHTVYSPFVEFVPESEWMCVTH